MPQQELEQFQRDNPYGSPTAELEYLADLRANSYRHSFFEELFHKEKRPFYLKSPLSVISERILIFLGF